MKKKILVYSLGVAVCLASIGGIVLKSAEKESLTVVTEEKKIPLRNAADTLDAGALTEETSLTEMIDDTEGIEKTTEYLSYYFDISLEKDGYMGGLKKICPSYIEENTSDEEIEKTEPNKEELTEESTEEAPEESTKVSTGKTSNDKDDEIKKAETVSGADMIKSAVVAAEKELLAQTYSEEKAKERLEFYGILENSKNKSATDGEMKKYIACALDLGMIDEQMAQNALVGELTQEEQAELLMAVANICGFGRNYIGYSNDERIYADLKYLYGLYPAFSEEELNEVAGIVLEDKNVQECVLKKAEYDARFLPSLTVCYSHESIEHMEQLIGLLTSENIVAKVQLEPKMIITQADIKKAEKRKEKTEDSEDKTVESIGSIKYDLVFEFETKKDMVRFGEVIETFAKVQETEEEKTSVIADSGIEAVYMTEETEHMLNSENAREIEKITVESGSGKLELYCLIENTDSIKEKMLETALEKELSIGEIKNEQENTNKEETESEETGLALYSKKYTCNKEFFFEIGGIDVEETEEGTEESITEPEAETKMKSKE